MAKIVIGADKSSAKINEVTFSNKSPNNFCVFNYDEVALCRIETIFINGDFEVRRVEKVKSIYDKPIDSQDLCMFVVSPTDSEEAILSPDALIIDSILSK